MNTTHRILLSVILIGMTQFDVIAQDKRDFGIQAGATYYYGEFNEVMPLYSPSFGMGVIFRYNINQNYSIRASAIYATVSGTSSSSSIIPDPGISFSKNIIGAEAMGEFNFFPLNPTNSRKAKLSPYVNAGVGIAQMGTSLIFHIPFGGGLKFTPGQRHTFALEWRFHKTFNDKIDDYSSPNDGRKPFLHNNDWFSFIGLIYTYRIPNNSYICPAYK
ncbi:MAG: DUF6089 family protein [Bacteroidota bacterium]